VQATKFEFVINMKTAKSLGRPLITARLLAVCAAFRFTIQCDSMKHDRDNSGSASAKI
jgi:hypothetical protein